MRFSVLKTFRKGINIHEDGIKIEHTFPNVQIDLEKLGKFREFFNYSSDLPFPYLYILAQRAQVALMLSKEYTISIPGMIHLSNNLKQIGEIDPAKSIKIEATVQVDYKSEGSLLPKSSIVYIQNDELVASCQSGYLVKRKRKTLVDKKHKKNHEIPTLDSISFSIPWNLKKSLGKEYAKISGDKNPIHTSKLFAKFLGFNRQIIHGWCSASQVIKTANTQNRKVNEITVNFGKPILLPSTVHINHYHSDEGTEFNIVTPEKNIIHAYGKLGYN